jgi:hypothetical protein
MSARPVCSWAWLGAPNITMQIYPPRVQAFRASIIGELPRAPNNRTSRASLEAMPTRRLILAYVTWRMRLIPAKPRRVALWPRGVRPAEFLATKARLAPLLKKVEAGRDLTPHLSNLCHDEGVVLPGANPSDRGKDIDSVLTRHGLHHFHVGDVSPGNPKGRSGLLVFAEVLEKEFRIVRAFERSSAEQLRFFELCTAYVAKDVPPGQAFMANPVMASGHSMIVTLFADHCEAQIERLDPQLDDPAFIDSLYNGQPILRDGEVIRRPRKPSLAWYFNDLKFGILDRRTKVFFCIYPFFDR